MPASKIVVVGSEDTVFGLGLLGLEGCVVESVAQARQAIQAASADPETALILLSEDWAEAQAGRGSESGALVVEIPGQNPAARSGAIEERIQRLLGVNWHG